MANLAGLFIGNQRGLFTSEINKIIAALSGELDFEKAAKYRDILLAVEKYWSQPRWQVWLDDTVDAYAVEDTPDGTSIFLITHRGRYVLGRKTFTIDRYEAEASDIALAEIIGSFYVSHLPTEIRVSRDFHGRRELAAELSSRFGRDLKIVVAVKGLNVVRGLHLNRDEHEIDKAKQIATPEIISSKLKNMFGLLDPPSRVEAFDVAHISGTGFAAASSVWDRGRFVSDEYRIHIPDPSVRTDELIALSNAVMSRLSFRTLPTPDLILLDGGRAQLNAVRKGWENTNCVNAPFIGAVKPRGKHTSISHFLGEASERIEFDQANPAHTMLQLLRDEAHNLANRIHRDYREMKPFYEILGDYEPVIVPLRYHAENGGAEDLIPIETR